MSLALEKALNALPHGPEFRFLDRLLELTPGLEGKAEYTVRGSEYFLRGHFPGAPIFPAVLLVEAAAQLAGIIAQTDPACPPLDNLRLTALRQVKVPAAVLPGQTVVIQARVTGRLGGLISADAQACVGGEPVLHATISLSGTVPDLGPTAPR